MKKIFVRCVENNIKEIVIITIIIFIGLTLSILYINNLNLDSKDSISSNVENMISYIKEKDEYTNKEKSELFKLLITKNITFLLLIAFLGTSIVGFPIICLLIIYKTFSFGFIMSSVIASIGTRKGIIFNCFSIGVHNIIYIVSVYIITISSIKLMKNIVFDKGEIKELKYEIIKHIMLLIVSVLLTVISSFIEIYISNFLFIMVRQYI